MGKQRAGDRQQSVIAESLTWRQSAGDSAGRSPRMAIRGLPQDTYLLPLPLNGIHRFLDERLAFLGDLFVLNLDAEGLQRGLRRRTDAAQRPDGGDLGELLLV